MRKYFFASIVFVVGIAALLPHPALAVEQHCYKPDPNRNLFRCDYVQPKKVVAKKTARKKSTPIPSSANVQTTLYGAREVCYKPDPNKNLFRCDPIPAPRQTAAQRQTAVNNSYSFDGRSVCYLPDPNRNIFRCDPVDFSSGFNDNPFVSQNTTLYGARQYCYKPDPNKNLFRCI